MAAPTSSSSSSSRVFLNLQLLVLLLVTLALLPGVQAIKFTLGASRYPVAKCIWNAVHENQLVIVTANVGVGENQRMDVEIVGSTAKGDEAGGRERNRKNVYLSKRGVKGETRLAVTTHAEGEVGVCLKNYVDGEVSFGEAEKLSRIVDLDIDIGADAVDYNAIANQESLSGLETEMRKIEGLIKEVIDEMNYLKRREERFTSTNVSTNERVQNFAWFTLVSLTGLGAWQILHLRAYFKRKYLID